MKETARLIFVELKEHLPFTIFSACLAMIAIGFATVITKDAELPGLGENLFHIFHPLHILASAATTTSMYWKYKKNIILSIIIGAAGSIVICSLSDIIFPFFGGRMLSIDMHFHICIINHPVIIIPFLAVGIAMGFFSPKIIEHSTIYSHSAHILLSTMASLVYLISFGMVNWMQHIGYVFMLLIFVVLIPCCISDIAFPLFFVKNRS